MEKDPLAEILAELRQEQGIDRPKAKPVPHQPPQQSTSSKSLNPHSETPAQSIDDLLISIEGKAELKQAQRGTHSPSQDQSARQSSSTKSSHPIQSIDDLLSPIEGKTSKPQVPIIPPNLNNEPVSTPPPSPPTPDHLLAVEMWQVAKDIEEQEKQKQRELEAQKREQLKAKEKEAKEWLKQLDRLSSDGIWFEQFAKKYPSELEAALDYLFG